MKLWLNSERTFWERQNLSVEVKTSELNREKPSLICHLESDQFYADLIVWASGEWELTKTDKLTDETQVSAYAPVRSESELFSRVKDEMIRMKVLST